MSVLITGGAGYVGSHAALALVDAGEEVVVLDDLSNGFRTCVRDYVHVSDLVNAHLLALDYLRDGGESEVMSCGYGRGASVLEVIEAVKKIAKIQFDVRAGSATRRRL
jgi:UDP-glucose 4-epimerase